MLIYLCLALHYLDRVVYTGRPQCMGVACSSWAGTNPAYRPHAGDSLHQVRGSGETIMFEGEPHVRVHEVEMG